MNKRAWKKIKYWKEKYRNTPNGWALSQMIGTDYASQQKGKKR